MEAGPIRLNANLGYYTNSMNLHGCAAVEGLPLNHQLTSRGAHLARAP